MYITHPTHGAGTRPGRTQPPTATLKTTLNADQCVRQPREGRGRNRQTPPPKKNRGGGARRAHSHQTAYQHRKRRPNPAPHKALKTGPPEGAQEDHPAKSGNTKPGATAHWEKGDPKRADSHHAGKKKKKEPAAQPEGEGMGGQRPQDPGPGQPATDTTKPKHNTPPPRKERKKNTPNDPTKKGGAQPRPEPSTHAHTAHPSQERQGTSGAHAQTHTQPDAQARSGGARHQPHPPAQQPPTKGCMRPRGGGTRAHTHPNTCASGCLVVVRCTVARCGAVFRAASCCAVVGRWRSAWPVSWCGVRVGVWLARGWGVRLGVGGSLGPCWGGLGVPSGLVGRVGVRGVALPGGLCRGSVPSRGPGP